MAGQLGQLSDQGGGKRQHGCAARRLGSRACVSRQISQLEAALGARLFEPPPVACGSRRPARHFIRIALAAVAAVDQRKAYQPSGSEAARPASISATMTFDPRIYVARCCRGATEPPRAGCELILTDQMVDLVEDRIDRRCGKRKPRRPTRCQAALADGAGGCAAAPDYLPATGRRSTFAAGPASVFSAICSLMTVTGGCACAR